MKIGYLMQAGVPDIRQHPLSGPAAHVKHVFDELLNLGHQVRLLAVLDGRIWKSDNLEDYEEVSVHWLDKGPLRLFERLVRRIQYELQLPYAAVFESFRFAVACRRELGDCELFYERMGWMGYGGGLASRWLKIPLVLEVNGDHLTEFEMLGLEPHGMQRRLSVAVTKKAAHWASHVVATGEGWRQIFIERWKVLPEKVTVVENGSEIIKLLRREELRAFSPGADAGRETTIIYIGAFEPWHGLTVLINAVAEAITQGTNIKLTLVGNGTETDTLKRDIHRLGIEKQVTFTGFLPAPQLAGQLAIADIGVSPYCGRVEYSGLKLLDYKAAGLATIASGECGQPAVLKHGQTGWIVPPCDEAALGEAIALLATNTSLRREIGRKARIEAEKYHSWQHTTEELLSIFKQITAKSTKRRGRLKNI